MSVPEPTQPLQNIVELKGLGTFLDHTKWHGVPVTLSTILEDGTVMVIGSPPQQFIIGSRPRTTLELAGYAARCGVQRQMLDVLEWLGERPLPWPPVTGAEVLDGIRRGLI